MARLLSPTSENWIEQRVFELLRDDSAGPATKPTTQAEPFEVAIVKTNNNPTLIRIDLGESLKFDMTKEIIRRKPRTPHQVEHGLGKVLIGFTNDASFLSRRVFPGKGAFEIGHGNEIGRAACRERAVM